ncbi:MAG: hypothetical protein GX620_04375 [Chloroflexi bacterium]|nr:hypothetical protein [Chloroflexota bacterium]
MQPNEKPMRAGGLPAAAGLDPTMCHWLGPMLVPSLECAAWDAGTTPVLSHHVVQGEQTL